MRGLTCSNYSANAGELVEERGHRGDYLVLLTVATLYIWPQSLGCWIFDPAWILASEFWPNVSTWFSFLWDQIFCCVWTDHWIGPPTSDTPPHLQRARSTIPETSLQLCNKQTATHLEGGSTLFHPLLRPPHNHYCPLRSNVIAQSTPGENIFHVRSNEIVQLLHNFNLLMYIYLMFITHLQLYWHRSVCCKTWIRQCQTWIPL